MKSEFGWGGPLCESPKTPLDPLRGKHKYSYQMEIAIKVCGIFFYFIIWVKMSHQINCAL